MATSTYPRPSHNEIGVTRRAVGLSLVLVEPSLAEGMQAEAADEVLEVVLSPHGGDAAAADGLVALPAQQPLPGVEVQGTEGTAIQLHEAASSEGLQAVL